jgi:tRNA(His) guanylyltransferase
MKFDELDKKLRIFETAHDFCVPPNTYIVARIDGRGFTRLTKDKHNFERPFDISFRDMMVETVKHLMTCGFKVIYGFTESDEISLLFDFEETAFARKTRKYNSILAGEASAKFSILLSDIASFDCRISQLPRKQDVVDYFRWRNEDAHRNALNAHCYWMLRGQGLSKNAASKEIEGKSVSFKNELLFQNGINFNELPKWQKRGIGIYWDKVEKDGWNPVTETKVTTLRNEIKIDMEIPMGSDYNEFIEDLLVVKKGDNTV